MARPCKKNPTGAQRKPARERAEKDGSLQKFYEALKGGLSRSSALAYCGLPTMTVYQRMDDDPNFRKKVEDCEEYRIAIVENAKRKKIMEEGYRPAIEKELESSRFERYGKKEKKEIDMDVNGDITITRGL